jgi:hypothetical protein
MLQLCKRYSFVPHRWAGGCICRSCGESSHEWEGCKCARCRVSRPHEWDGCLCRICGWRREEAHEWLRCRCKKCGQRANLKEGHDWQGCMCRNCHDVRNAEHAWNWCKCSRCGAAGDQHNWKENQCLICGIWRAAARHPEELSTCIARFRVDLEKYPRKNRDGVWHSFSAHRGRMHAPNEPYEAKDIETVISRLRDWANSAAESPGFSRYQVTSYLDPRHPGGGWLYFEAFCRNPDVCYRFQAMAGEDSWFFWL